MKKITSVYLIAFSLAIFVYPSFADEYCLDYTQQATGYHLKVTGPSFDKTFSDKDLQTKQWQLNLPKEFTEIVKLDVHSQAGLVLKQLQNSPGLKLAINCSGFVELDGMDLDSLYLNAQALTTKGSTTIKSTDRFNVENLFMRDDLSLAQGRYFVRNKVEMFAGANLNLQKQIHFFFDQFDNLGQIHADEVWAHLVTAVNLGNLEVAKIHFDLALTLDRMQLIRQCQLNNVKGFWIQNQPYQTFQQYIQKLQKDVVKKLTDAYPTGDHQFGKTHQGKLKQILQNNEGWDDFVTQMFNDAGGKKLFLLRHAIKASEAYFEAFGGIVQTHPERDYTPVRRGKSRDGNRLMCEIYKKIVLENHLIFHKNAPYRTANGALKHGGDLGTQKAADRSEKWKDLGAQTKEPTFDTVISLKDQDTVEAALELMRLGYFKVGILNFANANHPGGGYLFGQLAQEEDICRRTNLFAILVAHQENKDYPIADNELIYSPEVKIFRKNWKENFEFMDEPQSIAVVTQAAVDLRKHATFPENYQQLTAAKIRNHLRAFIKAGHDAIVVGAFGSGAFRGNFGDQVPEVVSKLYQQILQEAEFKSAFKQIRFAILGKELNYREFEAELKALKQFEGQKS